MDRLQVCKSEENWHSQVPVRNVCCLFIILNLFSLTLFNSLILKSNHIKTAMLKHYIYEQNFSESCLENLKNQRNTTQIQLTIFVCYLNYVLPHVRLPQRFTCELALGISETSFGISFKQSLVPSDFIRITLAIYAQFSIT